MSKELNKAPVEQAGGDERVAFEAWLAQAMSHKFDPEFDLAKYEDSGEYRYSPAAAYWKAWQARAALAQPSPAQAEAERPEVVASVVHSNPVVLGQCGPLNANDELMTVAQHAASVALWADLFNRVQRERDSALAEVERLRESKGDPSGSFDRCMKMMYERDENAKQLEVALARVAELTATRNRYGVDAHYFNKNLQRILRDFESFTPDELARSLIILAKVADEKVVAQAQQLHDLDKQCRDDVARALGLRPSHERGFAWSYLLDSIKSCVKASGDSAQAQHSVPEEFSFEYRHPNGECHTVTVSREQVINEMPDFLFEALCSKFCNCEPVGETNVVECCCDEYAEEFKLIAAAPGKEVGHE